MAHRALRASWLLPWLAALALAAPAAEAERPPLSPRAIRPSRAPARNLAATQASPLLASLDEESALFRRLDSQTALGRGTLAQGFASRRVTLEDGRSATLGELVRAVAAGQDALAAEARRAASMRGVLARPVSVEDEVVEFDDAYAIVQVTRLTVSDPDRLSRESPAFRAYRGKAAAPPSLSRASLRPESLPGFDAFLRDELPMLPADDPLRQAYAGGGEEALLRAVAEGKGTLEVADTLMVPKVFPAGLVRPEVENGVVRYDRLRPMTGRLGAATAEAADREDERAEAPPKPATVPATVVVRGSARFETHFLAGFTKGKAWEWERRWRFPSGFFRLTLRGHYGFGLRIPIAITGAVSPTQVLVKDRGDQVVPARASLTATTLDADAAFYEEVGLRGQSFGGKEAVCEAGFGWGMKFRALWMDIVHVPTRDVAGFDLGQDFKPPFGRDPDAYFRLEIPPSLTGTTFDWGAVSGFAQIGLKFDGRGTVKLDAQPFVGGRPLGLQHLRFADAAARPVDFLLPALEPARGAARADEPFGIVLRRPAYSVDLSVTPQVKAEVTVGYDWVSHTFDTGWMSLDVFRIHLGVLSLSRHAGTREEFRWDGGTKSFEHVANAEPSVEPPFRAALVSAESNRYVRAGLGPLSMLAATSERAGAWETFEVVTLGRGLVALRSAQSGKYVRIGVQDGGRQRMAAASPRADVLETFRLVDLGYGGRIALQAIHTGKYVRAGLDEQSYLAAVSAEIGAWEKFVLKRLDPGRTTAPPR
ncbi:MAG: hypothetical protein U0599_02410 [Vicinamibacteria bacterium]